MALSKQSVNVDSELLTEIKKLYLDKHNTAYGAVQNTLERGVELAVAELRLEVVRLKTGSGTSVSMIRTVESKAQRESREFGEWVAAQYDLRSELDTKTSQGTLKMLLELLHNEWERQKKNR